MDSVLTKRTKVHHDEDQLIPIEQAVCNVGKCDFNLYVPCTKLGNKLSTNLVRIAATRIFANPYQSILELPVNSVDSYMRMNKKPTSIGKFGMGFFSILYWLYQSPNSKLTIDTTYSHSTYTQGYIATIIITPQKLLQFKVKMKAPATTITTGTKLQLHTSFTPEDVKKFEEQCDKLFLLSDAAIYVNNIFVNQASVSTSYLKFKVQVTINTDGIIVEDRAEGIPYEVLTKSLLVPSSSTKTLSQVSTLTPALTASEIDKTNLIPARHPKQSSLYLTVNNVVVYTTSIPSTSNYDYILNLPSTTRLPVSRDDVILTTSSVENLQQKLVQLIQYSAHKFNSIKDLQQLFETYVKYTNQDILNQMYSELTQQLSTILSTCVLVDTYTDESQLVFNSLKKLTKLNFVESLHTDSLLLEKKLLAIIKSLPSSSISQLSSRLVVYLPLDAPIVTTLNTTLMMFVSDQLKDDYLTTAGLMSDTLVLNSSAELYKLNASLKYIHSNFVQQPQHFSKSFCSSITNLILKMMKIGGKHTSTAELVFNSLLQGLNLNSELTLFIQVVDGLYNKLSSMKFVVAYSTSIFMRFGGNYQSLYFDQPTSMNPLNLYLLCKPVEGVSLKSKIPEQLMKLYQDYYLRFALWAIHEMDTVQTSMSLLFPACLSDVGGSSSLPILIDLQVLREYTLGSELIFNLTTDLAEQTLLFHLLNVMLYQQLETNVEILELKLKQALRFIRYRFTSHGLYEQLRVQQFSDTKAEASAYKDVCVYPILMNLKTYEELTTIQPSQLQIPTLPRDATSFSMKQLVMYVYRHELKVEDIESLKFISEVASESGECPDAQLQVVDIAVNEGTTKNFVASVLTELLQNSIDAINTSARDTLDFDRIDINIHNNTISIKDRVGIPSIGLLSLLLPFLSTKNTGDTVGEMGSGFFNVFRQPYTQGVTIDTCLNNRHTLIKATPLIHPSNPARVVDIKYEVQVQPSTCPNGTTITIHLNTDNKLQLSDNIVNAYVFCNNFLPHVDGYDIRLNNADVNLHQVKTKFFDDDNIQAYYIPFETYTQSIVMTNNIPLMNFEQFLPSAAPVKNLIVNIKAGKYQPVHSRSKVHTSSGLYKSVKLALFYFALKTFILEEASRDGIIPNSSSAVPYEQLFFYGYKYSSVDTITQPTTIEQLKAVLDICGWMIGRKFVNEVIDAFGDKADVSVIELGIKTKLIKWLKQQLKSEDTIKVVELWFSNKRLYSTVKQVEHTSQAHRQDEQWPMLQAFVNKYWELGKKAYGTQQIKFNQPEDRLKFKLFAVSTPPKVVIKFNDLQPGVQGFYNHQDHCITLNGNNYDPQVLTPLIREFISTDPSMLFVHPLTNALFNNDLYQPGVIIHELLHAVTSTDEFEHHIGAHAPLNVTVGIHKPLVNFTFDETAGYLYKHLISMGLLQSLL